MAVNIRTIALSVGLGVAAIVGAIIAPEVVSYLMRDLSSAGDLAEGAVVRESNKRGYRRSDFGLMHVQSEDALGYSFLVEGVVRDDAIVVGVFYLPRYTESWYISPYKAAHSVP